MEGARQKGAAAPLSQGWLGRYRMLIVVYAIGVSVGVREYVVWRVIDRAIDWFELRDGAYVLREPDEAGIIESVQFPGLRLSVPSMLTGNASGVLAALRQTSGG